MSNKNRGFDIPLAAVVLAYIFCWPVGLVLTILKWVPLNNITTSSGNNKTHIPNMTSTQQEQYRQYQEKFDQYRQKHYGQKNTGASPNTSTQYTNNDVSRDTRTEAHTHTGNYNTNAGQNNRGKKKKKIKSPLTALFMLSAIVLFIIGFGSGVDTASQISNSGLTYSMLTDLLMSGYFFAGGGAMLFLRKLLKNRDMSFNRYIAIVGNRESMYIPTIAAAMSVSVKKAKRDLQTMIDKGYFGDFAYLDMSNQNIMLHSGATPQSGPEFDYRAMYDASMFGDKSVDKSKNKEAEGKNKHAEPAHQHQTEETYEEISIDSGNEDDFAKIIREIRRVNDAIDDEEVSERIYVIENITRNIFGYVGKNNEKLIQIRTFMNYYLPTTLKLLNSYSQIEKMGVAGENMRNAKENIEKILDMLVEGFQQQLDQLYKSEVLDISSDIDVLEQMMYKDGLAERSIYDMFGGGSATVSSPEDEEF